MSEETSIYSSKQMEGVTPHEQARRAIMHILFRIKESPEVGYYCGLGTQSFALLAEAYATLTDGNTEEIRKHFAPVNPKAPLNTEEEPTSNLRDVPLEELISESDSLAWLQRITPAERMEFFRAALRYCRRCGCDNVGALGCNYCIGRRTR